MTYKEVAYLAGLENTALVAGLLAEHDLPSMLRAIEHAETVGPIIDPTLYRDKRAAMEEDKRMLEAALPLWRWAQEQKRLAEEKGAKAS